MSRKHWTQTPEGKAKLAQRKAARVSSKAQVAPEHVAYCFGHVEAFIQYYAEGAGISRPALASGVAELLRRKAGR